MFYSSARRRAAARGSPIRPNLLPTDKHGDRWPLTADQPYPRISRLPVKFKEVLAATLRLGVGGNGAWHSDPDCREQDGIAIRRLGSCSTLTPAPAATQTSSARGIHPGRSLCHLFVRRQHAAQCDSCRRFFYAKTGAMGAFDVWSDDGVVCSWAMSWQCFMAVYLLVHATGILFFLSLPPFSR